MSNQDETLASGSDGEMQPDGSQNQPVPPDDVDSETVMGPDSDQRQNSPANPEDTVALPADQQGHPDADAAEQTFVLPDDQTIIEDTSFGDPGTIADLPAEEQGTSPAGDTDDQTVFEPMSGTTPPPPENAAASSKNANNDGGSSSQLSMSADDSGQTSLEDGRDIEDGTVIEAAAPDSDATFIEGASTSNAGPGGTFIEGATTEGTDPDGTIVEGSMENPADPNGTIIEGTPSQTSDPDGTIIEGAAGSSQTGATEFEPSTTGGASSKGNWNETREPNQKKPRKREAAHETANRWDSEQRYPLVTNFARGGLGQIWMANDSRLRREVAFKELLPSALKNRNALERFLEEAQITGQLEHPSIVPIYDIGYQENGTPFYAMKLVRGETMEKEIELLHQLPKDSPERALAFRRLLANFIDICNAMAFAHDRGVLHRDLKPLNVMIGAFGETLVLDWGLAKVIDVEPVGDEAPITTNTSELGPDDQTIVETQATGLQTGTAVAEPSTGGASAADASVGGQSQFSGSFGSTRKTVQTDVRSRGSQTMMGSVMGTPAYMPPEQAAGKLDELDARTDIYSLGGILYKLLTNHQPIARGKIREVLKNVKEGNIIPPRDHDSSIGKPIEAICMKALATNCKDRYESALKIVEDVEAWLADEPVSCYEDPWLTKAKRWAKRNRAAVQSTLIAGAILVVVWVGSAWSHANQMSEIRGVAQTKAQLSATAADEGDYVQARELLNEALGRTGEHAELNDLRGFLSSRLQLVETDRLAKLGREAESKLAKSESQILGGNYETARTMLAELATLTKDETQLPDISAEVSRQTKTVTEALAQQDAVADTQARFDEFLAELDQARIRSSFPDEEDVSEDANLAVEHVRKALALFGLDQERPLADPPSHFSVRLPWTRNWHRETGEWPLQVLREGTFELLLTAAEMERWLAQHGSNEAIAEAAERSLAWIAKAKSMGVSSQALLYREADYLQQAGRTEESKRVFDEAKVLKPETTLDFYLLAENLRVRGFLDEALEFYLKAQQVSPDHYWVQYFQGLCYRNLGEYAAAASSFSSCIARRPDYQWAYIQRGLCSAQLSQFENAFEDFDQAEKLDPKLFSVFVNRGVVLLTQGKFDDALKNLDKARELNPDSGKPLVNIAAAYLGLAGELQKPPAERVTQDEQATAPASDLEIEQQVQGLYSKALDVLAQAENNGVGSDPGLHQLRGRIYAWQSNTAAALVSYRRHLELDGNTDRRAVTLKRISGIHSLLAKHGKAVESLEASYKLRPSDSDTVLKLAEALLQVNENEKAEERYGEFLQMVNGEIEKTVPEPHLVYNGIATAFHGMRKKYEAVDYYTLSLMFDRRQAVPLTKRAWAFLEDNVELAIRDFEAAKELSPENPDTLIGLASAYQRNGRWEEARRELQTARPLARAQAAEVGPQAFALFHNAATVYSSRLDSVIADPQLATEEKVKLIAELSVTAVNLLREAHEVARTDERMLDLMLSEMQSDDALMTVRRTQAYATFVNELKAAANK
jgi:serine/threonine protein kinase/Flp pilus assembly protein TadD